MASKQVTYPVCSETAFFININYDDDDAPIEEDNVVVNGLMAVHNPRSQQMIGGLKTRSI